MVALGLFLLLVAGVVTAAMVIQNTDASSASVFGQAVHGTVGGLFLAGVVTGAVALLGVMLMLAGASRRRARRQGLKRQVRDARGEKESLAEENARLQAELEASRTGGTASTVAVDDAPAGRHAAETGKRHGLFSR
jgi:uncharacterized integral membrane protein